MGFQVLQLVQVLQLELEFAVGWLPKILVEPAQDKIVSIIRSPTTVYKELVT